MSNLKILVVDDDKDFAESMAEAFELRTNEVVLAFSGEEAIQKFKENGFDIIFMDVKLPGKNGVECFLEICKLNPNAKVAMMTGYSVKQLLEQAVENGAWTVLHKPFKMEQILEMIKEKNG